MYIAHGAARAPGRLIRVRIQVSLARFWGTLERPWSEAASPSPEGFRTAGHKKGTLPRSSIIHDQGSLGICRLRKGGRECAYLSRIDRIDSKTSWLVHVAGCRPLQE